MIESVSILLISKNQQRMFLSVTVKTGLYNFIYKGFIEVYILDLYHYPLQ
jgi:hypothetical protein